jgi:hypothetical protein
MGGFKFMLLKETEKYLEPRLKSRKPVVVKTNSTSIRVELTDTGVKWVEK